MRWAGRDGGDELAVATAAFTTVVAKIESRPLPVSSTVTRICFGGSAITPVRVHVGGVVSTAASKAPMSQPRAAVVRGRARSAASSGMVVRFSRPRSLLSSPVLARDLVAAHVDPAPAQLLPGLAGAVRPLMCCLSELQNRSTAGQQGRPNWPDLTGADLA
jgi:hypothetical protein